MLKIKLYIECCMCHRTEYYFPKVGLVSNGLIEIKDGLPDGWRNKHDNEYCKDCYDEYY